MSDPNDPGPPPDVSVAEWRAIWRPAKRRGAARSDAVPRMENVRVTAPDLAPPGRAGEEPVAPGAHGGWIYRAVHGGAGEANDGHDRHADGAASGRTVGDRDRRRAPRMSLSRLRCPASAP